MEIVLFVAFIVAIIVTSAIISGSEAALLSVSYTKAKETANENPADSQAKSLLKIKEDLQKYIATIVVLNNIINIVGSIYVGVIGVRIFGEVYLGVVSALLTFLIIMFSEIMPKIYGEKHSLGISLVISKPLIFLTAILSPVIYILNTISSFFITKGEMTSISEGEIKEMATLGMEEGSINSYERDVIKNVFKMDNIEAYSIMIPKNETTVLNLHATMDEIVETTQKTGFTRFPISINSEIIGMINVKDLFRYYGKEDKFAISKILRPVFYAPETMKIFSLQERLKVEKSHMAAIVNEHGDFTGIVTLEDIIEELVGEIVDEFDKVEDNLINKISDTTYHVQANIDIETLNREFKLDIDQSLEDFTNLNGYLSTHFGKIPKVNDKIKTPKYTLRVIKANKKKVLEVELLMKEEPEEIIVE
jgi:CBS domain containing-hemolysin-like protein